MLYPTSVIDNFFPNPDEVVKFSKSLDFKRDTNLGKWPGERTRLMTDDHLTILTNNKEG